MITKILLNRRNVIMSYLKKSINLQALVITLIVGLAMLAACEGPQGPEGPQGAEGVQGEQGDQGPKGDDGTANVIYSDWVEFGSDTTWSSQITEFGMEYRKYWITANQVDSTVMNTGVVNVYIDFMADTGIQQLPLIGNITGGLQRLDFDFAFQEIELTFAEHPNADVDPGTFDSGNFYRYVIIPGGQPVSGSAKMSEAELKSMSYDEVQSRFNIPDNGTNMIRK
jgi:hypothetical protein